MTTWCKYNKVFIFRNLSPQFLFVYCLDDEWPTGKINQNIKLITQ